MLNRLLSVALAVGALALPMQARADDVGAAVGGLIVGGIVGAAVASSIADEHRQPLYDHIQRENRPSYRYDEEVVVGRELRPGPYESYPVPERYGVPGHHYTVINDRPVIYHPQTRRIIHYY